VIPAAASELLTGLSAALGHDTPEAP
jgi:hypothetical protein